MSRRRGGFTFVEILISMMIIAILAGIVIPKAGSFVTRAKATAAAADIVTAGNAVASYVAGSPTDTTSLPPTTAMGQVPAFLVPYLGPNAFIKSDYTLQYNNWTLNQTINGLPSTTTIIGVTMYTPDATLGQLVMQQLNLPKFQSGDNYTFIVYGWPGT